MCSVVIGGKGEKQNRSAGQPKIPCLLISIPGHQYMNKYKFLVRKVFTVQLSSVTENHNHEYFD